MSSQSTSSERYDEVFFRIDAQMPVGKPLEWEELCLRWFGFTPSKMGHSEFVRLRHYFKEAVNDRAKRWGANWRLYMAEYNRRVVKLENHEMVVTEIANRLDRIAHGFQLIVSNMHPMLAIPTLTPKDKKAIKEMRNTAVGGAMNVRGAVHQMTTLSRKEKVQLDRLLSTAINDDEDEEA